MAKNTLPTNFKDDILNSSMGGKRRYNMIQNSDGTVSLEDASTYDQVGSEYGASQVNAANTAVNASADAGKIVDDIDDIGAITEEGYMAGALALKSVNNSLLAENGQPFQFAYNSESDKYGYVIKEADTDVFVPFNMIGSYEIHNISPYNNKCTIDSGGYYIKDGICYIDMIIKMLSTTSNNVTLTGAPARKNNSKREYFSSYDLSDSSKTTTYQINANESEISSTATSNHLIRIYGAYETTDADT